MRSVLAVALAACAHAPPVAPTQDAIKAKSHALLDAYDRGDTPAVGAALAPGFVHFEGGKPATREEELDKLGKRKPDAPHIGERTWKEEYVFVHPDDAVFVGLAAETSTGNEVHGGYQYMGWYTLGWRRVGGAWKVALWTWKRGGSAEERDSWNETFRNSVGFNKQPNQLLVDTERTLPAKGAALDVAMGQGRNALYLASQGWKVTGVDFSDEGLRQAHDEAGRRGLALETVNADLATYDFGVATWDLVTLIYAGDDVTWIPKIKAALRPGGVFVVEYFHDNDTPGKQDGSFAKGELAALFADGFDIVKDEIVDAVPDWALNRASLVRFVARKR